MASVHGPVLIGDFFLGVLRNPEGRFSLYLKGADGSVMAIPVAVESLSIEENVLARSKEVSIELTLTDAAQENWCLALDEFEERQKQIREECKAETGKSQQTEPDRARKIRVNKGSKKAEKSNGNC